MSLFSTLATGASGLGATGSTMAVIGDNIANINTTGYKGSRIHFADVMPQFIGAMGGVSQVGRGAVVSSVATGFGQGSLEATASPLDVAIGGNGFFQVADGQERYFTRDGSFHVDEDGFMITNLGHNVQGYVAIDGQVTSQVGNLQLAPGPIPQQEGENVTLDAILSAEADYLSGTPYATLQAAGIDGLATGPDTITLSQAADFATSVTVYDSLGVPHDVTVFFERSTVDQWTWSAVVDGGEVDDGTGTGTLDAGYPFEIASGTMTFDTDGNLAGFTGGVRGAAWNFPGADTYDFNLQAGLDAAGLPIDGEVRMTGSDSYTTQISQDGYAAANRIGIRVDPDGMVVAQYDNGEERNMGQLVLATFPSDTGLERVGGNLYRATRNSGEPALGTPGIGGRGTTTGYALERSNVDLEDEFVSMIQSQRAYQANAGVVRSTDETLQALVQLV